MTVLLRSGVRQLAGRVQRIALPRRFFGKEVVDRLTSRVSDQEDTLDNEIPKAWSEVDPDILPHLRSCEPGQRPLQDTGFHVFFLGTGAGNSDTRLSSCTLLRLYNEGILLDAGEGAQRYLRHSSVKIKKIQRILITHLHSDHVLGLPGVLLNINLVRHSVKEETVIQVYGPPGLYNFIVTNLSLTYSKLGIKVEVYELVGGKVRTHWKQRGMLGPSPQFRHENVKRKTINCAENGVWTLKDFDPVDRWVMFRTRERKCLQVAVI